MGDGAIAMARGDSGDGHQVNAERRDESAGPRSLSLVLRLDVPMQMYACLPAVLALAAARMLRSDGVDARVLWPSGVSVAGTPVLLVYAHAGYDQGVFAKVELVSQGIEGVGLLARGRGMLRDALREGARGWEAALQRARVVAGPLAPLLGDYFDLLEHAGGEVEVIYPNGRPAARGVLAGVDVWGRANVRIASGRVLELSPEQASLHVARG